MPGIVKHFVRIDLTSIMGRRQIPVEVRQRRHQRGGESPIMLKPRTEVLPNTTGLEGLKAAVGLFTLPFNSR